MATARGLHRLMTGMDYRVGDHYIRHEEAEIVDDLGDLDDATYKALVAAGTLVKVTSGKPTAGRQRGQEE